MIMIRKYFVFQLIFLIYNLHVRVSECIFMICVVASVLLELEISLLRKTTAEILKQKPYLHTN